MAITYINPETKRLAYLVEKNREVTITKEATVYVCKGCGLEHFGLKPKYPAHSIKGVMCGIWEEVIDN